MVVSGKGKFTVGSEEMEVQVDKIPTLITIPSNVPHQTINTGTYDLIWFYFFPETECIGPMRYFYPGDQCVEVYGRENANDQLKLIEIKNELDH